MKDYSNAVTAYDAAILVNSTDYYAFDDNMLTFIALGDTKAAIKNLDMALNINPNDKFAIQEKQLLILGDEK